MSKSPHPVVCPKKAIRAAKTNCTLARAAVRTFLNSNPANVKSTTLGGLNHLVSCKKIECLAMREEVKTRFPRMFEGK